MWRRKRRWLRTFLEEIDAASEIGLRFQRFRTGGCLGLRDAVGALAALRFRVWGFRALGFEV